MNIKKGHSAKYVPKNMVSSTKQAMANFTSWKKARNERFADDPEEQVPNDFAVLRCYLAFLIFAYKVLAILYM